MELLQSFYFVKAKPFLFIKQNYERIISTAVEEMNLIKAKKLETRDAEYLCHEL